MHILFTKSDKLGSKLIRAVLDEKVSHCAVKIGKYVLHSTFLSDRVGSGVELQPYSVFCANNQILYTIKVPGKHETKLPEIYKQYYNKSYDVGAFVYLGLKYLLAKIKIKLPKKNLWQTSGMFLCTEFVTDLLENKETHLTPEQLYYHLKSREEK